MHASTSLLPDHGTLTAGLTSVFTSNGYTRGQVTVLDRELNRRASTFPSEIVTCRFDDGRRLRLFCKYDTGCGQHAHGHRGGVNYEAEVYRRVLQPIQVSTPTFYGTYTDSRSHASWLILEYVERSVRVKDKGMRWSITPVRAAMGLAARWSGQFHAAAEARLSSTPLLFLKRYDTEYYLDWARRTSLFAGHLHRRFPWLATLCERFAECITPLLAPPPAIIHGEFYANNVLIHDRSIYPIDWESAAIAVGEIDLAALTERWPAPTVRDCVDEYQHARWPTGAPATFEHTLNAAQLYLQVRWLGERPDWTTQETSLWRFHRLHALARRAGLL